MLKELDNFIEVIRDSRSYMEISMPTNLILAFLDPKKLWELKLEMSKILKIDGREKYIRCYDTEKCFIKIRDSKDVNRYFYVIEFIGLTNNITSTVINSILERVDA